jgi:hypothetical protein
MKNLALMCVLAAVLAGCWGKEAKDKMEYLRKTYTEKSFSTSTDNRWYNETLDVKNFNVFIPVYCNFNINYGYRDIEYALKDNLLTIKIVPERREFLVPLDELLPELRAIDETRRGVLLNKPVVFETYDYTLWISEIDGRYYEMGDTVSVIGFTGYLFYNR